MKCEQRLIRTPAEWARVVSEVSQCKEFAFDTEYESRGYPNVIVVGFSLAWRAGKGRYVRVYVPLNHYAPRDENPTLSTPWVRIPNQLSIEQVRSGLQQLVHPDGKRLVIMHNAQADLKMLHLMKVQTDEIRLFDTMIASWMLETDRRVGHGLKPLTKTFFTYVMVDMQQYWPNEMVVDESKPPYKSGPRKGQSRTKKTGVKLVTRTPLPVMEQYASEDAYYTLRLKRKFAPLLQRAGLDTVFTDIFMELVQYLTEMEEHGMVIDRPYMVKFARKLRKQARKLAVRIYNMRPGKMKGVPVNLKSYQQLNKLLFDEMGIEPRGEANDQGFYSTKAEVLEEYAYEGYTVARLISSHNEKIHLAGMIEGWIRRAVRHPDGSWRLHGNFNLHGTRTGRLSSSDPNLQNIPVRNPEYPIRKGFIPRRGYLCGDADYSQIELKLLAHFSKDERMCRVMNAGGDLHSETAKVNYHLEVPEGLDLKAEGKYIKVEYDTERSRAKGVNFALVYGAGAKTIAYRNDIPLKEVEDFLARHPKMFPQAHRWMDRRKAFARQHGFVTTIVGRKRHLPDAKINPFKYDRGTQAFKDACWYRAAAERRAVNSTIQGSAGDIIGIAMVNIRKYYRKKKLWFNVIDNPDAAVIPAAQVHDELVFYLKGSTEKAEKRMSKIKSIMDSAMKLRVPTDAEGHTGPNWLEAKK